MKKLFPFFTILLIAISFASKISAQSNTEVTVQDKPDHVAVFYTGDAVTLPTDFPVFVNTGDGEKDNINYTNAVDSWIAQHPKEYKALLEKNTQAWKEANPTENKNWSDKNNAVVQSNEAPVTNIATDKNKEVYYYKSENGDLISFGNDVPADFPSWKRTGDLKIDTENYRLAKEQYYSQHK